VPVRQLLVVLVALVPGIAAWWTGRPLVRLTDDPALPELLWARRQRGNKIVVGSIVVIVLIGGYGAFWGLPLLLAGLVVGGHPLRRALGINVGGIHQQLWYSAKSVVGGLGFWILLVTTPQIVVALDPRRHVWSLGIVAAIVVVLFAWEHWSPRIWLWFHDAEPLAGESVLQHIAVVTERSGMAQPAVLKIGGAGTRLMNAFAFPHVHHPAIGMGNALVELLEPDEVAAIYAHELSHIEQYSPRRARRAHLVTRALILAAVALPLGLLWFAPSLIQWTWIAWLVVFTVALFARGRHTKHDETTSDLRAAALCGDAETVVRALIKVHVHGFIPRRWAVDFERGATHPSLARRIQSLRGEGEAANARVATTDTATFLPTAREGSIVVFERTRASWFDGVPSGTSRELDALRTHATSARTVAWPELVELRVETRGGERFLKAAHRNGDSWSVPLAPDQVAATQRALDVVDIRLHRELTKRPLGIGRLVAWALVAVIFWVSQVSVVLLPALVAAFRPSTAIYAALGAMAVASGLAGVAREWLAFGEFAPQYVVLLALGGAALAVGWHRIRREQRRDGAATALWILGGASGLALVAIVGIALELSAREAAQRGPFGALALLLIGIAAVVIATPPRRGRRVALAPAAGAFVVALPLLASADLTSKDFTRVRVAAREVGRVTLSSTASSLRLSPDGSQFLVRELGAGGGDYDDEDASGDGGAGGRFVVGDFGANRRTLSAMDADFIDNAHILTLHRAAARFEVRLEDVADSSVVWTAALPALRRPALTVSRADRAWAVSDLDPRADSIVYITGTFDSPAMEVRRDPAVVQSVDGRPNYPVGRMVHLGRRVVFLRYDFRRAISPWVGLLTFSAPHVELWESAPTGQQRIGEVAGFPDCQSADLRSAVCVVGIGVGRPEMWLLGESGPPKLIGRLPTRGITRPSVGPGPSVSGVLSGTSLFEVDVPLRRLLYVSLPRHSGYASEARAAPTQSRFAVVEYDGNGSAIVLYAVDGESARP
jgi:Zn-dependent protease with chaperone function